MTMMALTRKRHRATHLWALAAGLVLVAFAAAGVRGSQVSAIAEGDVQFTVSQSPVGGSTVQVGSQVSFVLSPTVSVAPFNIPLYPEFLTPTGFTYMGSNAPGGISCGLIPRPTLAAIRQRGARAIVTVTLTSRSNGHSD